NYFFNPVGGGTGPELKINGSNVAAGQFGSVLPIAAEQTASGYDVAFKATGADLYTAWSTDSAGNYLSNLIGSVSGSNTGLETLETVFQQDLNKDGRIGLTSSALGQTFG